MSEPSKSDYLNLSQAAYFTGSTPTAPSGWSVLTNSQGALISIDTATGMQAVAFTNGSVVVIAYEGTNTKYFNTNTSMFVAQMYADRAIKSGASAPGNPAELVNAAALSFAEQVALAAGSLPLYVTGHSLGGEEAQYVAAHAVSSGLGLSGGATFGAPGVPNQSSVTVSHFTNYLDAGDIIGKHVPSNGVHIGSVETYGNPQDIDTILDYIGDGHLNAAAGLALVDHSLDHYASDLGVTLVAGAQNQVNNGSADIVELGVINGTPLFGTLSTPQITNGNLVDNGDTLSVNNNLTTLTLHNGQVVNVATATGASFGVPTTGSLSLVSALPGHGANTVEIVNTALGTTTFTDLLGNQIASYASTDLAGGSVKVNGDKIEAYDAGNKLKNSTQEITTGTNTAGVLDKTYELGFTTLTIPASWNQGPSSSVAGISDDGRVIGLYFGGGFEYDDGTYTQINLNGGTPQDINDNGDVVGYNDLAAHQGFEIVNGTFTQIINPNDAPAVPGDPTYHFHTFVKGINNAGTIVGFSTPNNSPTNSFIVTNGNFSYVNSNPWTSTGAWLNDINDNDVIVGNALIENLNTGYIGGGGFIYNNGNFAQVIAPDAYANATYNISKWNNTMVSGINDAGIVVGTYCSDLYGTKHHGFVDINGTFITIDYPNATYGADTYITGINDNNEIVGYAFVNGAAVTTGFIVTLDSVVSSKFYLENSGNVDLAASTELAGSTVNLVAGNNAVTFSASKNIVNGALGATLYNFGALFAQDVINNAFGGNTAANGEIDFTSSTITKQKLWLTQSGNDLVVRLLGTTETVTVTGWFGSNAGAKTLAIKTVDGLELTPTRVASLVAAMATYQSGHSSFNAATATSMPTDTTLQNAITAAWIKYDTLTTNGDGSKTGILNDHTGADWTYIEDSLTSAGLLNDTFQQFDDNSNIFTDYNLSGLDGWTKGVHKTNALGQETESIVTYVDDSYDDILHFFSGTIRAIDNYYNAENVLLDTFQDNFDNSSIETSFNPSGEGGWIKGVHYKNTLGQETEDIITYVDNTYDDITHNLSGGLLDTTDDYHSADGTLVNTTKEFTDGSEISIDYDNDDQDWATGTRVYDPSHNLLQTDVLYDDGGHWFYASTYATTLNGGTGYNGYEFTASAIGNDTINNGGGTSAHGEIDFDDSSITKSKLWFKQAGNDLTVQKLGSSNKITVAGWYTSGQAGNQVESFHAGGLTLDTQVAQLVNAMASYQSSHSSFNPNTTSTMPTDTTLQNAITAAWHS